MGWAPVWGVGCGTWVGLSLPSTGPWEEPGRCCMRGLPQCAWPLGSAPCGRPAWLWLWPKLVTGMPGHARDTGLHPGGSRTRLWDSVDLSGSFCLPMSLSPSSSLSVSLSSNFFCLLQLFVDLHLSFLETWSWDMKCGSVHDRGGSSWGVLGDSGRRLSKREKKRPGFWETLAGFGLGVRHLGYRLGSGRAHSQGWVLMGRSSKAKGRSGGVV